MSERRISASGVIDGVRRICSVLGIVAGLGLRHFTSSATRTLLDN